MSTATHYNTILQHATAEFKDRGSRFIAFAYPATTLGEIKQHISQLKKEHPKANHFCYAYILGATNSVTKAADDGEPSGSAGKPILNQILSKNLVNVVVVVVRYFGGTLLGVPGLINAYKTAAALCLQMVPTIKKNIETTFITEFDYTLLNDVLLALKQTNATIYQQNLQLFCDIKFGVSLTEVPTLQQKFKQLYGAKLINA
jgi:uncharacterized YigZ family protein